MLKYVLLASAITISAPALAQTQPAGSSAAPIGQTAPTQSVPSAADPSAQQVPADPSAVPSQQPVPGQQAAAQPVSGAAQIAEVVNAEFPAYDKDKSGTLSEKEFGSWMVALKEKSDPTTKADSASTKAWVDQAFASADKDKNKALSKDELTTFLSQGA